MKIRIDINAKYKEPEIRICNGAYTEEVQEICETIKAALDTRLTAYSGTEMTLLSEHDIIRIYAQDQKVYADTKKGRFRLRERLYELEEKLDGTRFLRISNSEIVNLYKIERLDASVTGTIKMYLQKETITYVSRRYVAKIKKALGI